MSIFTAADVVSIKADRLMKVANDYFPDAIPSDSYILEKLQAEEANLEHQLRTLFDVREILPDAAPQSERDLVAATGAKLLFEPGYDYDPGLFYGDTWGLIPLRNKPVVAVHSIRLAYPNATDTLYAIPNEWIRVEKQVGRISLVPGTGAAFVGLPVTAFMLSALGGGRTIPLMVQVRYSAGIPNIRAERPDIVDLIKKMAVLAVLDDQYFPASGSDSVDGLSQSLSIDTGKYRDLVDKRIASLGSSLSGIRVMVM